MVVEKESKCCAQSSGIGQRTANSRCAVDYAGWLPANLSIPGSAVTQHVTLGEKFNVTSRGSTAISILL